MSVNCAARWPRVTFFKREVQKVGATEMLEIVAREPVRAGRHIAWCFAVFAHHCSSPLLTQLSTRTDTNEAAMPTASEVRRNGTESTWAVSS